MYDFHSPRHIINGNRIFTCVKHDHCRRDECHAKVKKVFAEISLRVPHIDSKDSIIKCILPTLYLSERATMIYWVFHNLRNTLIVCSKDKIK